MNRAVHPAASGQRFVGRVDDRIGPQPGNVPFNQPQYRLPDPRLPHPRLRTEFQVSSSKFQEEGSQARRPPETWNSKPGTSSSWNLELVTVPTTTSWRAPPG